MIALALVSLICRRFPMMGVNEFRKHTAIINLIRCCRRQLDQLRVRSFDHLAVRAREALLLALAAKAGLGIREAAFNGDTVSSAILLGMSLLGPLQVDLVPGISAPSKVKVPAGMADKAAIHHLT